MGLDTYAMMPDESAEHGTRSLSEEERSLFSGIKLVGGVFSSHGCAGSFRGKIYSGLIERLAGESLFQEWMSPETVRRVADCWRARWRNGLRLKHQPINRTSTIGTNRLPMIYLIW